MFGNNLRKNVMNMRPNCKFLTSNQLERGHDQQAKGCVGPDFADLRRYLSWNGFCSFELCWRTSPHILKALNHCCCRGRSETGGCEFLISVDLLQRNQVVAQVVGATRFAGEDAYRRSLC